MNLFIDVDEGDMTQVLAARVAAACRKVDANEVVEDERLGRLRVVDAPVGQGMTLRLEEQAPLDPFHDSVPSSSASPKPWRPTWLPR